MFASIRFEDWGIFVVNADGTGERAILAEGGFVHEPAWSPDGGLIAFVGSGFDGLADGRALYVMRPDGSEITRLTTDALDEYGVAGDIAWQPLPSDGGTLTSPSPTATSSPVDIGPAEPHASTTIQIDADGRQITDMAAGQGALWATLTEDPGTAPSSLVRIDPASNQVAAEIPLDGCTGELACRAPKRGHRSRHRSEVLVEESAQNIAATDPRPGGGFSRGRAMRWTEAEASMRSGAVVVLGVPA